MEDSQLDLSLVLDSITEHIVVINKRGEIQYVNRPWSNFGHSNGCIIGDDWRGVNYLAECDKAAASGDEYGSQAAEGIRSVIDGAEPKFYLEYPCHSNEEQRWFMMRVTPLQNTGKDHLAISHQNITERKLAEDKIYDLARTDGLTNIPNRRAFNEFIHDEWRRCLRLQKPICLAMLDLDNFKLINDTYGHRSGDDCLVRVAALLKNFALRPSDLCVRYGGEEFAFVWGDISLEQAELLSNKLLKQISAINILDNGSPTKDYLTASIGLAAMIPKVSDNENALISKADNLLYLAKENGRNRVESEPMLGKLRVAGAI